MALTQLERYDEAVRDFLKERLGSFFKDSSNQLRRVPVNRALASKIQEPDSRTRRPTLPIVSFSRQGLEWQWERSSTRRVRLGYTTDQILRIKTANYPLPIALTYQVDLWAEKTRSVQELAEALALGFIRQMKTLTVPIDADWQSKYLTLFLDSIADTSDLEVNEDQTYARMSLGFRAEGWLFDPVPMSTKTVWQFLLELRDEDTDELYAQLVHPKQREIATGNGAAVNYAVSLDRLPIGMKTLAIYATVGAASVRAYDGGAGVLSGTGVSGTINYSTGALTLAYTVAPDNGTSIFEAHLTGT